MSGARASANPAGLPPHDPPDLVGSLDEFLATPVPKFFLIVGKIGSGKSTLLRTLSSHLTGAKLFVAYQPMGTPPSSGRSSTEEAPSVRMLLVRPGSSGPGGRPTPHDSAGPSSLAFSPPQSSESSDGAEPLVEAIEALKETGVGSVVVDSWDRGSETYFRSQAVDPADATVLRAPASALQEMQAAIVSTPVQLLLAVTPDLGDPLLSVADAVVTMREDPRPEGRLRIATINKIRGRQQPLPDHLYTLEGGRFYSLPGLPRGFRPPVGPDDPDPDPQPESAWPGSTGFGSAFGRLRFGGITGLTLSSECPDTVPHALVAPAALHTLRSGGKVVWILPPSMRPSQIVQYLRPEIPDDSIRERLRILAPSRDDTAIGDLRSVILPLAREARAEADVRPAEGAGVRSLFPEAHRFLRDREEGMAALMVGSFEGLRASAATAGVAIDATTIPVLIGAYARLPKFHLFGYCDRADPVVPHLRPGVDTHLDLDMVHGRPVLFGLRPRTAPYILDWPDASGRYRLVVVS